MQHDRPPAGFIIDPRAVYDDDALRLGLQITQGAIDDAKRSGFLRSTRQGTRTLYLGEWVLAWLSDSATTRAEARP